MNIAAADTFFGIFGFKRLEKDMSKIMYRTTSFDDIEKVSVERSTEKSVWVKEKWRTDIIQYRKNSDSINFFDTFDEAKSYLATKYEKVIAQLENQLNHKRQMLERIKDFKIGEIEK